VPVNRDSPMWIALAAVGLERVSAPLDHEVRDGGILGLEDKALSEGAPFLRLHLGTTEVRWDLAANGSACWRKPAGTRHREAENGGGLPASPQEPRVGRDKLDVGKTQSGVGSGVDLSFGHCPAARLR
jgi:hypothetical protein